ncbi:MAG: flagellar hook-length control protein FliK [Acidobacteria bacterium]|nr:flagellar hook-length control protein FliK [Acidobacteriota bacterium]
MELLPVGPATAGDAVGPAAASVLAGRSAADNLSAHPAGLLGAQDPGNNGAPASAGFSQSAEDSRLGSSSFAGRASSLLEDNFSVVWLSAIQITEGQPLKASPAGTLPSFADSIVASESAPADPALPATAQPRQGTATTARQTIFPAFPLLTLAQPAAEALAGGQTMGNAPSDATPQMSAANVETERGSNTATPAGIHSELRTEGLSQSTSDPASGRVAAEPADVEMVRPEQAREGEVEAKTPRRDNVESFLQSKDLKIRQRESNEPAGNEHDRIQPVRVGNASTDGRMPELQEIPAAEGFVENDLPNKAPVKEGPKPQEVLLPAANPWNRVASAASTAPPLPPARGTRGDSHTSGSSDTPRGASVASLMRGRATLSESGNQQSPPAGETAFKAEIQPKITGEGQNSAASAADAGQPARQGHHATPANVSLRNLTAATQVRETEPISELPSQPRSLPAKTADSHLFSLPGSPQPSTTSAAPRPSTPAAPLLATESHVTEFEPARPSARPAGDVTVQLRTEEHGTANIRFREQAGQVQVTVRAGDPQLVHSLRAGLDHLKSGLDLQGFQTTVFNSSSTAVLRRGEAEGSSDTYHRAHEEPSAHERGPRDHSGRGNRQTEEWMDETE